MISEPVLKDCISCNMSLPIRFFYTQRFINRKKRPSYVRGKCKMCYSVDRKEKGY